VLAVCLRLLPDSVTDLNPDPSAPESSYSATELLLSALEVFLNDMRYINPRFTYLLTYLPRPINPLLLSNESN